MKEALEEMWAALAAYQPQAEEAGHGKSWERMCREKTPAAAYAAYSDASTAAAADAAVYAAGAVYAAALAANADANARMCAQKAINRINSVIKPSQRKPLTDEEIIESNYPDGEENGPTIAAPDFELICFARQIEAKLKEKNT